MLINSGSFTLLKNIYKILISPFESNADDELSEMFTLFNEILLDPTNVVLNSLPTTPTTVVAAAGD